MASRLLPTVAPVRPCRMHQFQTKKASAVTAPIRIRIVLPAAEWKCTWSTPCASVVVVALAMSIP